MCLDHTNCSGHILHSILRPVHDDAFLLKTDRLRSIPEVLPPDLESVPSQRSANNLDSLCELRAPAGRLFVCLRVDGDKEHREHEINDPREQEGQPVSNVLLRIGSSKHVKGADIYESVENEHRSCGGSLWINNDPFTRRKRLDVGPFLTILIEDRRSDIGLEDSGTERQKQEADDERRSSTCRTLLEDGRDGPNNLNNVGNSTYHHTHDNGFVSTYVDIGPPTTDDWNHVREKDEEQGKSRRRLKAHS